MGHGERLGAGAIDPLAEPGRRRNGGLVRLNNRHKLHVTNRRCSTTSARKRRSTTREKVRRHRTRLREQGLRPVQVWVPDTRAAGFAEDARRQTLIVSASEHAESDQTFVDAINDVDLG